MATTKITITIEDQQLEEIRALVAAGTAASVSGRGMHSIGEELSLRGPCRPERRPNPDKSR
jgi:primase-polymerase (primpol)-like protein